MPWEKSFDVDEIVDKATTVFWAKGYEASSMADLLKATGINKGSLYNAFGSKKQLFLQSLLKYDREQRQTILSELTALNDPKRAVASLFDALIEQSLTDTDCKGCLLVNTALDMPNQDADIQKVVTQSFSAFEQFFQSQLQLAEPPCAHGMTIDETAKSLLSIVVGLRVLARGVFTAHDLNALKKQAVFLISA